MTSETALDVVPAETLAGYMGIKPRQIQSLTAQGILSKESHGKYPVRENIQKYIEYKTNPENFSDQENRLRVQNLEQDLRRKRRENDEADRDLVPRTEFVSFLRKWSKHVGREHESIPATLDGTMIECPKCDHQMRLDGRGRQRVQESIIRMKNYLHDLHESVEGDPVKAD